MYSCPPLRKPSPPPDFSGGEWGRGAKWTFIQWLISQDVGRLINEENITTKSRVFFSLFFLSFFLSSFFFWGGGVGGVGFYM